MHRSMHRSNAHLLLVNPWVYDFAAYDYWLQPLGLISIAGLLRQNGFHLSFVDCLDRSHPEMHIRHQGKMLKGNQAYGHGQFFKKEIKKPGQLISVPRRYSRYGIHPDILQKELKKVTPSPEAILMSTTMTYWYPGTSDTLLMLREIFPNTPVIIGGNYVTLCPEHARKLGADHYICGQGAKKVLNLLSRITGRNITFMPDEDDLDQWPYPAFDLLNQRDYVCIQTSKGCPFNCSYCASNLLNKGFKRASPPRVINEIEHWVHMYGVKNIVFYDDALLFEPDNHMIPILRGIMEKGLKHISFHTPNGMHARFISSKLADLMFKTGFKTIRLGYETANPHRQTSTGGKVYDSELESALTYLRKAGFRSSDLGVYILIGLPGQEADEVKESIYRVVRLGGTPILSEFSPIPNTAVWEESLRFSRYNLADDPLFHNNSILPCAWSGFTWEDYLGIKSIVKRIHREIMEKGEIAEERARDLMKSYISRNQLPARRSV